MAEHPGAVTFKDNPLTLVGEMPSVGEPAPDATALDSDLNEVRRSDCQGKVAVICSVPSLDTPVCDAEMRRFNDEATRLSDDVVVAVVSMDLPFAQKRWCGAAGADRVMPLSDHRDASFGQAFGVLVKELRLLARAVFVVDREGKVRYVQLVKEITEEPDYDAALAAVRDLQ